MHAGDLLTNRARLTPEREALLMLPGGRRYTYGVLNERANRAANWMLSLGVEKGDRVSILAHNGIEYIDLFYGLAKIGVILAPLNWRLVAPELIYIVNDCQPKVLICGPDFVDLRPAWLLPRQPNRRGRPWKPTTPTPSSILRARRDGPRGP
jgi:fatty-acyl-CoA synthase